MEQIESLRDWWSLAGVDLHYDDEPASLLTETVPVTRPVEPKPVENIAATESKPQSNLESTGTANFSENYPSEHDEFLAWLSAPENLVEAQWSQNHILPNGVIEPEIMTIVGMPEQSGLLQNSLFSDKSGALLVNMLKAIGCDSQKTYSASISLGRSFDGRIDPQYHDALKKRVLHHIGLVRPKRIIIFGDTPSGLFFNENLLTARKNKQFVNHSSSKIEAIATFHPRILIERPEFKAEAWRDLQLLTRIQA
ncbi:uracil-DNA glycosylase [Parasphingorhabdus litoris]|uniref:Uracil-DNA glycosylase n=1 Tax=Parasphingorhabdus litoris TaxID=394733 RepID=A0ABP3KME3_9SPHN